MQTEMSVEIERPIDEVFDYTTNHVVEWSKTVVEETVVEEKPGGVGTTFHMVTEDRGRRMEFDGIVTAHEPPTASAVALRGAHFDIEAAYSFEELSPTRTRVTQRTSISGKGFFRIVLFLFGWLMKKSSREAQQSELADLKHLLESRAAEPPPAAADRG